MFGIPIHINTVLVQKQSSLESLIHDKKKHIEVFTLRIQTDQPEQTDQMLQNTILDHGLHSLPLNSLKHINR